jgi:hypothetical protein
MALVDTGASAQLFIDISFAHSHELLTQKLQKPRKLQLTEGSPTPSGTVYEKTILNFKLHQHIERASGFITKLNPAVPIILGLEWLRLHDPSISWARNSITLDSNFCRRRCLQGGRPVTVIGLSNEDTQTFQQPGLAQMHIGHRQGRIQKIHQAVKAQESQTQTYKLPLTPRSPRLPRMTKGKHPDQCQLG